MNSSRSISRSFFSSSRNPFRNFLRFFFQEFLQYLCLSFLTDSWSFIFQNFQKHGLSQKLAQDFSHKFLQKFLIKFFWIFLWSHLKEFIKVLPEEGFSWRIPWTTKLKDSLFSDISTKKKNVHLIPVQIYGDISKRIPGGLCERIPRNTWRN